jgi:hypothetical protein
MEQEPERAPDPDGSDPTVGRRRPLAIVVLSALLLIIAILNASALLGLREAIPGSGSAALLEQFGDLSSVIGVLSLSGIIPAIGLWLLRRWAWYWAMIWTGTSLAYQILLFVSGYPNYAYLTIYVVTAFYLNQRDVKGIFETQRERPPAVTLEDDRGRSGHDRSRAAQGLRADHPLQPGELFFRLGRVYLPECDLWVGASERDRTLRVPSAS